MRKRVIYDIINTFLLKACGLVKNLAFMAHITTEIDETHIKDLAFTMGVEDIRMFLGEAVYAPDVYTVFINGKSEKELNTNRI